MKCRNASMLWTGFKFIAELNGDVLINISDDKEGSWWRQKENLRQECQQKAKPQRAGSVKWEFPRWEKTDKSVHFRNISRRSSSSGCSGLIDSWRAAECEWKKSNLIELTQTSTCQGRWKIFGCYGFRDDAMLSIIERPWSHSSSPITLFHQLPINISFWI